jgi:hypothetical protein
MARLSNPAKRRREAEDTEREKSRRREEVIRCRMMVCPRI